MAISILCDKCGRSYSVKPEIIGRKVQCKGCGHAFVATAPAPEPELVELTELPDLNSYSAAPSPGVDLAASPLTSHAVAPRPRPPQASSGLPKPALIAIIAGGGLAALLLIVVIVSAIVGGGDDVPTAAPGNPALAGTPGTAEPGASTATAPGGGTSATLAVTSSPIDPGNVPWSVTVDPTPSAPQPFTAASLATGDTKKLYFARRDQMLALACREDNSTPGGVIRAEKFNLATGQSLGGINFPAKDRVLGFSADGKYVFAGSNGNEGSGFETLRVWSWSGELASEVASFIPFPKGPIYKTLWAGMPRSDVILTVGGDKELAAWSFPNPQPLYVIKSDDHDPPLLTPGGKYFAVRVKDAYRFFEVLTGKPAGQTESADGLTYAYAETVHPDGDRAAALCPQHDSSTGWRACVWDLRTGKLTVEADVIDHQQFHVQFCEAPFLLAGNTLIDLERGASVWKYKYSKPAANPPDTRLWFCGGSRGDNHTYPVALPSAQDRTKIDAAWANSSVVVPQGDSLAVEAVAPADAPATHNQQALAQKATQMLEEAGYQVAADQSHRLRVTVSDENSGHTIEFRAMASSQVIARIPDRRLQLKVAIVDANGQDIWSRSSTFGPSMIARLDPATSADPAKAILGERWQRLSSWLDTLKVPSEITSVMTDAGVGVTEIKGGS